MTTSCASVHVSRSLPDTQFIAGMRSQRIVRHQLIGDLFRERGLKPTRDIDSGQLLALAPVVSFEFGPLQFKFSLFCVRL